MKFLIFFLFAISAYSMTHINLRSLTDVSSRSISLKPTSPRVISIFQKDCSACRHQIKNLNCLDSHAEVLLVGSFSSEKDLRKELKNFKSTYAAYYGDKKFKKLFKLNEGLTPQTIISQGSQQELILGVTPCEQILKKLQRK